MDNQKGSVKDRIRARLLYLEYKKYKRKKTKEINKRKKQEQKARIKAEQIRLYGKTYSKPKVFGLTLLGLLLGLFTPKNSKSEIQKELDIIEKEKKQIFLRLEQDQDIKKIYDKIDNTYQRLEDLKKNHKTQLIINSFDPRNTKKLLYNIDQKQKELIVINEICHKRENQIYENNKNNFSLITGKSFKTKNQMLIEEQVELINMIEKNNSFSNDISVSKLDASSLEINPTKIILATIKEMNINIKDYTKEIDFVREKISQEEMYNTLFEYEFKLKQLKKHLVKMLEDYKLLNEKYELEILEQIIDIDVIDKYELRKDDKSILKKIEECEILFKKIEDKKEMLTVKKKPGVAGDSSFKNTPELVQQKKSNNKKKEEEKKELKEEFDELYLANKIILNNIMEETKMVERLKRKLSNVEPLARKRSIFSYAKRFTVSILSFGFSLLPLRYFRNRLLGTLVSSIMMNNSLRTTKKILNYDADHTNYLLYNNIIKDINSNQDYISRIYDVCLDSQVQIKSIREHLNANFSMISEYDAELLDFYKQLDKLSHQLDAQISNLEKLNNNYINMKQKVKVKEGYFDKN